MPRLIKNIFITLVIYYLKDKHFQNQANFNIAAGLILSMFQILMFDQIFIFSRFSGCIYMNILMLLQMLFFSMMSINRIQKMLISIFFQVYFAIRYYIQFKDKESVVFELDFLTIIIPFLLF